MVLEKEKRLAYEDIITLMNKLQSAKGLPIVETFYQKGQVILKDYEEIRLQRMYDFIRSCNNLLEVLAKNGRGVIK